MIIICWHLLLLVRVINSKDGDLLVRAAQSMLADEPQSRGIAVYVTQPQHLALFYQHGYQDITELTIGNVVGTLLFQPRAVITETEQEVSRAV